LNKFKDLFKDSFFKLFHHSLLRFRRRFSPGLIRLRRKSFGGQESYGWASVRLSAFSARGGSTSGWSGN